MIGKHLTIQGVAVNRKGGAALQDDDAFFWIDGLDSWPADFRNQRVEVAGLLEQRDDSSAFVPRPGEPIRQGIPVADSADLMDARQRYVLRDATWKLAP